MTQLDIFSSSFPSEIGNAIAWATKIDDRLVISFKNMDKPLWVEDESLTQWLNKVAGIKRYGMDTDENTVIELETPPSWLIDKARNHKADKAGSNHPINAVMWSR